MAERMATNHQTQHFNNPLHIYNPSPKRTGYYMSSGQSTTAIFQRKLILCEPCSKFSSGLHEVAMAGLLPCASLRRVLYLPFRTYTKNVLFFSSARMISTHSIACIQTQEIRNFPSYVVWNGSHLRPPEAATFLLRQFILHEQIQQLHSLYDIKPWEMSQWWKKIMTSLLQFIRTWSDVITWIYNLKLTMQMTTSLAW